MTPFIIVFLFNIYAADFKAKQPVLITSAGQSADVLMVKILAQKQGIKFTFEKLAKAENLNDHATLILVCGGSSKGLGAANIDKDQELERVLLLIKRARDDNMNVIAMHVGGKARRGNLSDGFNTAAAENADFVLVVKGGDEDGLFRNIAKEKKIPLRIIENIADAGGVMKEIFISENK